MAPAHPLDPYHAKRDFGATPEPAGGTTHKTVAPGEALSFVVQKHDARNLHHAAFESTIPEGHYGAGTVIVWDRGSWQPLGDAHAGLPGGHLEFELHGEKPAGHWALVRLFQSTPKHSLSEIWKRLPLSQMNSTP